MLSLKTPEKKRIIVEFLSTLAFSFYLFLKDHCCLQARHDVLKQAASFCIEGKFSAGHHVAIHQLCRKINGVETLSSFFFLIIRILGNGMVLCVQYVLHGTIYTNSPPSPFISPWRCTCVCVSLSYIHPLTVVTASGCAAHVCSSTKKPQARGFERGKFEAALVSF